jgi:hypothetical protein
MKISRHIIARVAGILCLVMVAVFCFIPIYDFFAPWPPASQALAKFGRHFHFCVGMSSESSTTVSADGITAKSNKQRAFILIRAPISWPKLVAISQDQDGRATIAESAVGFWFWLVLSAGMLWGAWRLFVRYYFF